MEEKTIQEKSGLDVLDYLVVIAKHKLLITITAILVFAAGFAAVTYLIPEKFEASVTIIPSEGSSMGEFGALLKNIQSLPINLGKNSAKSQTELYAAIIFSRTALDTLIERYDLKKDYKAPTYEKLLKAIRQDIIFDDKDNATVHITVLASSAKKAADMANDLARFLNKMVIELNVRKSRDNRAFIEQRYKDIKNNLKGAEDSLLYYQRVSGVVQADEQIKATINANTALDQQLAKQEIELSVAEQIYGKTAPQTTNLKIAVEELRTKVKSLKSGKEGESFLLQMPEIPLKAIQYFRYYRDVKIFQSMLEFILPVYEQAKFDEQKDMPVIQVLDTAVPPEKKSYPPRTLFSLFAVLFAVGLEILFLVTREVLRNSSNPKVRYLRSEIFSIRKKSTN